VKSKRVKIADIKVGALTRDMEEFIKKSEMRKGSAALGLTLDKGNTIKMKMGVRRRGTGGEDLGE